MHKKRLFLILFFTSVVLVIIINTWYFYTSPGERLAREKCAMCHEFPEPAQLTKKSWDYLLTYMGFHFGIVDYSYLQGSPPMVMQNIHSKEKVLLYSGVMPPAPTLSDKEWKSIRDYYASHAPSVALPQAIKKNINETLTNFELKIPSYQPSKAITTLLKIDEHTNQVLIGNNADVSLTILDKNLTSINHTVGFQLLVDAYSKHDSLYILSIGDLMGRYAGISKGYLQVVQAEASKINILSTVVTNLARPADVEFADLEGDGVDEIIVCNFGDVTGNVSIYKRGNDQLYTLAKELIVRPGAVKCIAHDFDHDGKKDLSILFGDAKENLSIFFNRGNNNFERKVVIQTGPAYGHTYFELQDFNSDGNMDILVANGDSDADPYNTLKNYHGIRIYLNDGDNNFKVRFFYPMYGVHFARACDFDLDGDLDIAALSFFPDFDNPKPENFTYLENKGNFNFETSTHPEFYSGRWMVMDIGDLDGDGDKDIILGGAYLPIGMSVKYMDKFKSMSTSGKALLYLENKIR